MLTNPVTVSEVPVPVPDDLAAELRAIAKRRKTTEKRREADEALAQAAVVRAKNLGCADREIGRLLGMSHVAVAKLERRAREGREGDEPDG